MCPNCERLKLFSMTDEFFVGSPTHLGRVAKRQIGFGGPEDTILGACEMAMGASVC
jgi:hypothetical protein